MQFIYKRLNNVQTQLITWGNPFDCSGSDIIVCVTGNPGIPDFYIEFATELHKSTGLPICVIGQAGHVQVPDVESNILNKTREPLFDLKGQLAHKLDLLHNHLDKRSKLHLIGHSIGAWMLLEILNEYETAAARVSSLNLLFPTVQRMADSSNGKFLNGFVRKIHFLVILLFTLLYLLPECIRSTLVGLYLKFNSLPPHYVERILKYINPAVGEKVLFLAYDEMDTVREPHLAAIEKVKHFTNVIYGSHDNWAPVSYMEDLKQFQPPLEMKEVDISHTFVLKSSERVAEMVADFIKSKL